MPPRLHSLPHLRKPPYLHSTLTSASPLAIAISPLTSPSHLRRIRSRAFAHRALPQLSHSLSKMIGAQNVHIPLSVTAPPFCSTSPHRRSACLLARSNACYHCLLQLAVEHYWRKERARPAFRRCASVLQHLPSPYMCVRAYASVRARACYHSLLNIIDAQNVHIPLSAAAPPYVLQQPPLAAEVLAC